ncbi:DNA phosphorothioation system restriction enzyme [Leptolyngbya sp. 'hensonii']|uniref:DNA phosphorothioation system restriction enzyme n=1 Tax=Leptolyngbya sp. 'hensonii' TaxID=1922337 RepID=UPI00095034B5|nr:DNA phosphorothioation system restriction enzyme [Leptolyngbya sp. 'hensonii']
MSLKDLALRNQYRSDRHNLLQDFYVPCLSRAVTYDRAVGFFSSTSLALATQGLSYFIQSNGRMRLVASPHLSAEDIAAIEKGLKQRDEAISDSVIRELEQEFEQILGVGEASHIENRLACLAWLLSKGFLEIKLAVHCDLYHQGIYHEKLGVFTDSEENQVVFSGSANESASALRNNFECIDVFRSWRAGDDERILEKLEDFQRLWDNQTLNLEVMEFPEAARRSLLKRCPSNPPILEPGVSTTKGEYQLPPIEVETRLKGIPSLPFRLQIRPYQRQAIDNWFANKGRGTLKMATGSGKTITALSLSTELYKKIGLQVLLVVCPYRHLVSQWARECQKFGLEPILAFENVRTWQSKLSTQLYNVRSGNQSFLTVITTNATLMSQGLQSQLPYLPEKTLIVGDEAHNLGARRLEASLPRNVGLRLALSATPERYFDDRGTQSLFDYFGSVLEPEFTLRDAIEQGALVHYLYYPILVELTEQEAQTYAALSIKIGRLLSLGKDQEEDEALKALLMQRSRLVGAAANKLDALRQLMKQRLKTQHTLFYCGDGSVEETSEESRRQLEEVAKILGRELGYRINTYTAETSLEEREDLRRQFETGELQGLVAIRCLDEGVDIPAVQTAVIMASSSNPRQFIQRRGRILRRHPNKQRATLFDMIVLPPEMERETSEMERSLLRSELRRFAEFADLADNAGEARLKLLGLQTRYGLLDV